MILATSVIILRWLFKDQDRSDRELDWPSSGYGQVAGSCECGNEHSGSKNAGISWLAEYLLVSQEGLRSMEILITDNDWHQVRYF